MSAISHRHGGVLERYKEGAIKYAQDQYVGYVEINDQQDRNTSEIHSTVMVHFLNKKGQESLNSAIRQHERKNLVIIDFTRREKPILLMHHKKLLEISKKADEIAPAALCPMVKVKRSEKELKAHPAKGPYKKRRITEGFSYAEIKSSNYKRFEFRFHPGTKEVQIFVNKK